ncbi:MAG: hypothetical protein DMF51_05975 [Acidobacteria bacterium]|nr:MAG: hypothetical protein DMF51_05975 [Acidobacteriota bacterium]
MSESPRSPSRFPGGIPQGAQGADLAFYTIADRYLDDSMRAYPTGSTMAGYHKYDGLLEDLGATGIQEKTDMARRFQAELAPIDPRSLTTSARIDHRLVTSDVDATLLALTELRPHERDPQSYVDLLGNSTLYLTLLDPGSPAWSDRLASLLSRMQQVPRFLSDARANLQNPPRVITDMVIHTNAGSITFFERTAPILFARAPALAPRLPAVAGRNPAARFARRLAAWQGTLDPQAAADAAVPAGTGGDPAARAGAARGRSPPHARDRPAAAPLVPSGPPSRRGRRRPDQRRRPRGAGRGDEASLDARHAVPRHAADDRADQDLHPGARPHPPAPRRR